MNPHFTIVLQGKTPVHSNSVGYQKHPIAYTSLNLKEIEEIITLPAADKLVNPHLTFVRQGQTPMHSKQKQHQTNNNKQKYSHLVQFWLLILKKTKLSENKLLKEHASPSKSLHSSKERLRQGGRLRD